MRHNVLEKPKVGDEIYCVEQTHRPHKRFSTEKVSKVGRLYFYTGEHPCNLRKYDLAQWKCEGWPDSVYAYKSKQNYEDREFIEDMKVEVHKAINNKDFSADLINELCNLVGVDTEKWEGVKP